MKIATFLASACCSSFLSAQGWTTADGEVVSAEGKTARLAGNEDPAAALRILLEAHAPQDGPGTVLAVRVGGRELFAGARGLADLEHGVACGPATVFDMASLAKSVTAAAIQRLVEEGALELEDGVRTHLPELHEATFGSVKLRHLLHHTAGIEDVDGLLAIAGWRAFESSSFADELRVLLGQRHLRFAPGSQHMYSNGGYVLLAEVAQRASGEGLAAWARTNLFEPLGMQSARLAGPLGTVEPGLAAAYSGPASARRRHPPGATLGAGGLLCSVPDLARWGEELATGAKLGRSFAERMRATGTLDDGKALTYASGLGRGNFGGHPSYQHSGSTFGGQAMLVLFPQDGMVLAAATNDGDGPGPAALLEQVVALLRGRVEGTDPLPDGAAFLPATQPVPEASRGVTCDPAVLARYAGVYRMSEGPELVVAAEGETLRIGFGTEASIAVFPLKSGRFLLPPVNYEFSFEPALGRATLHVTERSMRRGQPRDILGTRWAPAPLDARARAEHVGTYRSEELGVSYEVEAVGDGFVLVHPRHGRLSLRPLAPDVFLLDTPLAKLTFRREAGKIRALELEARSWGTCVELRKL
jgi:CubicO group peptidase (beta-lactamase class C family)